jgi:ribosomal protein L7/L12
MEKNMIRNSELDVILAAVEVSRQALRLVEGALELKKARVNKDSVNNNSTPVRKAGANETEFTVTLMAAGDRKIEVIKEVNAITRIGLKEAKDLVQGAPKAVKEGVNMDEACRIKTILENAGAKVELVEHPRPVGKH